LANRAGLNRVYTGDVERGQINIAFENLLRLLEALELQLSEFANRYEQAQAASAGGN
jgi:transcriptional regulator with XRE-family HTH domain